VRLDRLAVANYRGVRVSRTLGLWLAAVMVLASLATALLPNRSLDLAGRGLLGGALLVFGAGLVDDLAPAGPRGLRNHLRLLGEGTVTTGVLKLVVAVGAAVVTIAMQGSFRPAVRLAGVALVAGTTNVWNGLDVRPGRALKAFLVVGAACALALPWSASVMPALVALLIAGALPALVFDLKERAMLGDSGANLLGFVAGVAMYHALPGAGVVVAAVVVVALNVVADTIGFSSIVDRVPPLRWFDRLGGRRDDRS
jgi:UDP-GlcNAc:undecaprenyl-phosphate/decaprenyl-phosphate GlcNAc-1-phosphate transferase